MTDEKLSPKEYLRETAPDGTERVRHTHDPASGLDAEPDFDNAQDEIRYLREQNAWWEKRYEEAQSLIEKREERVLELERRLVAEPIVVRATAAPIDLTDEVLAIARQFDPTAHVPGQSCRACGHLSKYHAGSGCTRDDCSCRLPEAAAR